MSTNYRGPGNTVTLIAPSGGVVAGTPYIIGGVLAIPLTSADATDSFEAEVYPRVVQLSKASGTTAAAGDPAYLNTSTKLVETSDSTANRRIGIFNAAATSGVTTCDVRLDGVSFGAGNDDLEAKADSADLASTTNGLGASLIGIEDALTLYTAENVEAALAEVKAIADAAAVAADLASTANGDGAALIGVEDAGGLLTADNVEDAFAEVATAIGKFNQVKDITIALGAATGSSAADPDWIGATVKGCFALSGNDQAQKSVSVAGDGAVTVTVGGNETAEAVFRVTADLA